MSRHPDIEKWELRDEPILSLPGLEINLACRKITSDGRETIGFHVRNLRKKLFDTDRDLTYQIESIRDVGYRFQYS